MAHWAYSPGLIARADVIGVAVGFRRRDGELTDQHVLKVYVQRKQPLDRLRPEQRLPNALTVDGVEVELDIEEIETPTVPPRARQLTIPRPADPHLATERRPLAGGFSIAHFDFPVGTVAVGVLDLLRGYHCVLSCNHVLARMNAGIPGDAALQPAQVDGGVFPDKAVGGLLRFVPVWFDGRANRVDAAIAACRPGDVTCHVHGVGPVTEIAETWEIAPGDRVTKVGRSSGLTEGTVLVTNMTVKPDYVSLGYADQSALFVDQIVVDIPAAVGDSGSLLLDDRRRAVGMLFGGLHHSWFNPFGAIRDELGIVLLPPVHVWI